MAHHLILVGPPGAGKGTQAKILEKNLGLEQISTGEMLRARAKQDDDFGREIAGIMSSGQFVTDDHMIRMLAEKLQHPDTDNGFILDGFPRTQAQAEALEPILVELGKELDCVIELTVDESALVERITGRLMCSSCGASFHKTFSPPQQDGVCDLCSGALKTRSDDTAETVVKRLKDYHQKTEPVLAYYQKKGLVKQVDGMQDVAHVTASVMEKLGAW